MFGSSSEFAAQIYLAGVLGRGYYELKEQGETLYANEPDITRQKLMEVRLKIKLEGYHLAAMRVVLDKTAREQYETFRSGRR